MATLRSWRRSCGQVDGGHAAGADLALDAVAVGQGRLEAGRAARAWGRLVGEGKQVSR